MKDILGKDIEVGDYIVYIQCLTDRNFEEAIVVRSDEKIVIIEYLGRGSETKYDFTTRKKKGDKSRLTSTKNKIFILNSNYSAGDNKNIYKEEKKRFDEELKKIKKKLSTVMEAGEKLAIKNKELKKEVNKIHDRFDILDL